MPNVFFYIYIRRKYWNRKYFWQIYTFWDVLNPVSQFLQNVCVCDTNIVAALDQKLMVRFSCILMYVIFLPQAVMYRKHFCVGIDEILVPYLPFSMLSMLDQV